MSSRETILASIRRALATPTESPHRAMQSTDPCWYPALDDSSDRLLEQFGKQLERLNGTLCVEADESQAITRLTGLLAGAEPHRCWYEPGLDLIRKNEKLRARVRAANYEANDQAKEALGDALFGITSAIALVARHGTILVSAATQSGRLLCTLPDHHIVLATKSQIVPDLADGYAILRERFPESWPSFITNITGPSRTADIEKILVLGAHGPKDLTVIVW